MSEVKVVTGQQDGVETELGSGGGGYRECACGHMTLRPLMTPLD